jgi:hypothetical protein
MKIEKGIIVSLLGIILLACEPAAAAEAEESQGTIVEKANYHPCTKTEVMTTWKLVLFREQPQAKMYGLYKNKPFRYYAFYPDQRFVPIVQNTEITDSAQVQKTIAEHLTGTRFSYVLDEKGQIFIYRNNKPTPTQIYSCNIMNIDFSGYKKGDMAWSGYSSDKTQIYQLFRHY